MNLTFEGTSPNYPGPSQVSLYEFYWAPYTEDKISYKESLKWLIRTGLTPLRQLSANLQELLAAEDREKREPVLWIFFKELLRTVLLYIPLVAALGALFFWIVRPPSLTQIQEASRLVSILNPWLAAVFALCATVSGVLILSMLGFVRDLARRRGQTIQARADKSWFALALVFAFLFGLCAWYLAKTSLAWGQVPDPRSALYRGLELSGTAWLVWLVRKVLVDYVGDIAIYVSTDEKSKGFVARSQILKQATDSLIGILMDDDKQFDQVIVAGHSLGSVIAYDTINRLFGQTWAWDNKAEELPPAPSEQLKKLKGLITFGSPLDKIYYFFRQEVNEDQAVRAQIISFLHPFRRARSGRDYGNYLFTYPQGQALDKAKWPYAFPDFGNFRWLNVWSSADPVSGYLNFYDVEDQLHRWYPVPLLAHLAYWRDPEFYRYFAEHLLFDPV